MIDELRQTIKRLNAMRPKPAEVVITGIVPRFDNEGKESLIKVALPDKDIFLINPLAWITVEKLFLGSQPLQMTVGGMNGNTMWGIPVIEDDQYAAGIMIQALENAGMLNRLEQLL